MTQRTAEEIYPKIDVSEALVVPPLRIISRSLDYKMYKIIAEHEAGDVTIIVRDSLLTPKQDGSYTVLKADAIDILA